MIPLLYLNFSINNDLVNLFKYLRYKIMLVTIKKQNFTTSNKNIAIIFSESTNVMINDTYLDQAFEIKFQHNLLQVSFTCTSFRM